MCPDRTDICLCVTSIIMMRLIYTPDASQPHESQCLKDRMRKWTWVNDSRGRAQETEDRTKWLLCYIGYICGLLSLLSDGLAHRFRMSCCIFFYLFVCLFYSFYVFFLIYSFGVHLSLSRCSLDFKYRSNWRIGCKKFSSEISVVLSATLFLSIFLWHSTLRLPP